MTDQTDAKVYCPTYADIVANFSTVTQSHVNPTKNNPNEETVSPLQISDGEACQLSNGFIGVQRKRGKTKKFF